MAKDAVATMGDVLPADAGGRDAVHVAVFSATAVTTMYPGEHVGILREGNPDVMVTAKTKDHVGIVDPFLKTEVDPGQRFWVYLYPRTITSLSHKWGHPAFSDAVTSSTYVPPSQQVESEQWLRVFCDANGPGYDAVMSVIKTGRYGDKMKGSKDEPYFHGRIDGEYMYFSGADAHGELTPEFWQHVENVLGEKVDEKPSYFSCSC